MVYREKNRKNSSHMFKREEMKWKVDDHERRWDVVICDEVLCEFSEIIRFIVPSFIPIYFDEFIGSRIAKPMETHVPRF